jgi:hypothetical protein
LGTRLHCPAYQDFVQNYLNGDNPVVITDALDDWKTRPQSLASRFPGPPKSTVKPTSCPTSSTWFSILRTKPGPATSALRRSTCFLPLLLAKAEPIPPYFLPNWLDGGGKFPYMHFDGAHTQAFICQLYGTKKFCAYPANQTPYPCKRKL